MTSKFFDPKRAHTRPGLQARRYHRRRPSQYDLLRRTTHITADVIYEWDPASNHVIYLGDIYGKLGISSTELDLTAAGFINFIHPDDRERTHAQVAHSVRSGQPLEITYRVIRKDGEVRCWLDRGRGIYDREGALIRFVGVTTDITAQKQAEEAVLELNITLEQRVAERGAQLAAAVESLQQEAAQRQKTEENYRIISELASDFAFEGRFTGPGKFSIQWITGGLQRHLGYDPQEIQNIDQLRAIVHPEDRPIVHDVLVRIGSGQTVESEFRVIRKNGSVMWLSNFAQPVLEAGRRAVLRFFSSSRDITGRRMAEQAHRREARRLELVNQITTAALSGEDTHQALVTLVSRLCEFAGANEGFITSWDPDQKIPLMLAATGDIEQRIRQASIAPGERSLTRTLLEADRVLLVRGDDGQAVNLRVAPLFGLHTSVLGLPLRVGEENVGAVALIFNHPPELTAEDFELWQHLTDQVSLAVASLQLFAQAQHRAVEMEKLVQVSSALRQARTLDQIGEIILRELALLVGAERSSVMVRRKDRWVYFGHEHPSGSLALNQVAQAGKFLSQVFETGEARFYASVTPAELSEIHPPIPQPASLAVLPIKSASAIIGVVTILWSRRQALGSADLKVLTTVAEMAGNAMERAALLDTLEQRITDRTRDLKMLYELASLSNETSGAGQVLERALERLLPAMRARAGVIYLYDSALESLDLQVFNGLPAEVARLIGHFKVEGSLAHQYLENSEPVYAPDFRLDPLAPAGAPDLGYTASLWLPMRARGSLQGIITLLGSAADLNRDEKSLFVAVSDLLGSVVANARLQKHLEETVVMEERQRLARELHDSVTQSLYSLTLFARAGREHILAGRPERAVHYLERLSDTTQRSLREMRMLLYELRQPELTRHGLAEALRRRLESVEQRVGLETKFNARLEAALSPEVENALFWIALEALNNVLKHAAASKVRVDLSSDSSGVLLEVQDNGCGFDPEHLLPGGLGLVGMRERALKLQAALNIVSAPGQGTCLEVSLPWQPETGSAVQLR